MNATTFETKDVAKANGRPIGIFHATVTTGGIAGHGLDHRLVGGGHLDHGGGGWCDVMAAGPTILELLVRSQQTPIGHCTIRKKLGLFDPLRAGGQKRSTT
jgi:hypothetical protein